MPERKHVEVDDIKDFKELFNLLCDEVMHNNPMDVRRGLLGFRGTDAAVMENKIHADDIFKIIRKHDLDFKLRVEYTTSVIVKSVPAEEPPIPPSVPDSYKQMEEQGKIIPPELLPPPPPLVTVEPVKPYLPPADEIPEFEF